MRAKMPALVLLISVLAACSPTEKIDETPVTTAAIEVSYDVKTTNPASQPEELGDVAWIRNYDQALAASKKHEKPVFLLFTEVPGCSTVKGFANGPLSDPRIVEAIQTEFIPLAIYNNINGGHDAKILKKFGEPSWNNPVVRFLDTEGADIADRYGRDWRKASLTTAMVQALEADGDAPDYLKFARDEFSANTATAVFSMYCFWTGELKFSAIDGVVATRPGFMKGREVVEVTYDKRQTDLKSLARAAKKTEAAGGFFARNPAQASAVEGIFEPSADGNFRFSKKDDKYQIRKTNWRELGLSNAQATRLNRARVSRELEASAVLTPSQLERWK